MLNWRAKNGSCPHFSPFFPVPIFPLTEKVTQAAQFVAQKTAEITQFIAKTAIDIGKGALSVAGKIWNSPNSALGLALGFSGVLLGGDWPVFATDGIHFPNNPLVPANSAVTLGNVSIYGKGQGTDPTTGQTFDPYIEYRSHETQHMYQGEALGPAYLPLHIIDKLFNGFGPNGWLEKGPYSNPSRPWPR